MSGRVLVIDDVPSNCRLLEAILQRQFCEVSIAVNGLDGLRAVRADPPELVLLDWRLPDIDGLEVCRLLKQDPSTRDVPIILVTAFGDREARLLGLSAGADDFLSKPVDPVQLTARVRNMIRWKRALDVLRKRYLSMGGPIQPEPVVQAVQGRVLLLDSAPSGLERALSRQHQVRRLDADALFLAAQAGADVAVLPLGGRGQDTLRLVARLQSREQTRRLQLLCLVPEEAPELAAQAVELGAHDLAPERADDEEVCTRVAALLKRTQTIDAMQAMIDASLELAVTDPLTGLYNRRYLLNQLRGLLKRAELGGPPVSLLFLDLDHFKRVNDDHGHDAGDCVLREFAARVLGQVRPTDFVCRLGGEEFLVVLSGAPRDYAILAADRIRRTIEAEPFLIERGTKRLTVTASIGVTCSETGLETPEALIKRADTALFEAKAGGRNRAAAA